MNHSEILTRQWFGLRAKQLFLLGIPVQYTHEARCSSTTVLGQLRLAQVWLRHPIHSYCRPSAPSSSYSLHGKMITGFLGIPLVSIWNQSIMMHDMPAPGHRYGKRCGDVEQLADVRYGHARPHKSKTCPHTANARRYWAASRREIYVNHEGVIASAAKHPSANTGV